MATACSNGASAHTCTCCLLRRGDITKQVFQCHVACLDSSRSCQVNHLQQQTIDCLTSKHAFARTGPTRTPGICFVHCTLLVMLEQRCGFRFACMWCLRHHQDLTFDKEALAHGMQALKSSASRTLACAVTILVAQALHACRRALPRMQWAQYC